MNWKFLRNPRVIEFLNYLYCLPAAWIIGNYGALWVTYIEGSAALLYFLYGGALILLMIGMLSPLALVSKRWQLFVGIPMVIGILTIGMPHINALKVMADARLMQVTTDASDKLIAV